MGKQASKRFTKADVINAIKNSYNNTSLVAKRLGVEWHTAERLINKWTETRQLFNDELEIVNDVAELNAFALIKAKDPGMIKWWLSKKAKNRGFGDDNGTTNGTAQNGATNGANLQIEIVDAMPLENASDAILEPPTTIINDEETPKNEN